MSDIEVTFATNADQAAAAIDTAEKATGRAASTADRFVTGQHRMTDSTHMSIKALRGAGLAAGLMGAEFGGATGKIAGMALAGASIGGPWGAAIGAAIGVASAAIGHLSGNAEEAVKRLDDLKSQLEKVAATKVQLTGQAASEGNALNAKSGAEIRANIYETGSILGGGKSAREQALINMGMAPDEARGKAESEQRYRDNGGLLGGREQNGAISPFKDPYQSSVIQNLNQIDETNRKKEEDQKLQLATGEYNQAIIDNEKNTKGVLELLKKVTSQEGRLKVQVQQESAKVSPKATGGGWSWSTAYWDH